MPGAHVAYGGYWSGIYVGASLGGAWGDSDFLFANGLSVDPRPIELDGALSGGFHIGIQRQWGRFVAGLEASVLLTDLDGSSTCDGGIPPGFACSVTVDQIWMVGPRLGLAANNLHFYGTGGYARGALDTRTVDNLTGVQLDSGGDRHNGWYLGGGIEWSLTPNFVLGIEYRRIELDDAWHSSSTGDPDGARRIDAEIDTIQARLTLKFAR